MTGGTLTIGTSSSKVTEGGVVFDNVTIPAGATIKGAVLRVAETGFVAGNDISFMLKGQSPDGGALKSVTLTNGGSGYQDPIVIVSDSSGDGHGASVYATQIGGVITSLSIISAGSGYVTPIITIGDMMKPPWAERERPPQQLLILLV